MKTKSFDKPAITAERLLELGGSLEGILRELQAAVGTPAPNPRKRVSQEQQRVAHYLNMIDARTAKRKSKSA